METRFYEELKSIRDCSAKNSVFLSDERYQKLVNEVNYAKSATRKESRHYWLLKRYDVMFVQKKAKLIFPVKDRNCTVKYYLPDSELFHVLHEVHLSIGHGGRDRMIKELNNRYKNITRHDIELYIQLCEPCQKKQKGLKKGLVVEPLIFSDLNSRCQVDLIDFQTQPDNDKKFIMVYQDHLTKFVVLRPLKSNGAEEIAYHLIDIFTLLRAPTVLQSDNSREFSNKVLESLKYFWPTLKIVHGKPQHFQSQGSVERANQDIKNMLSTWMQDENTNKWSEGLRYVQLMKNRAYHSGIRTSPYEALFGCKVKVGLGTSSLPQDVIQDIETEEELENIMNSLERYGSADKDQEDSEEEDEDEEVSSSDESNDICCVCSELTFEECKCRICNQPIHLTCGRIKKTFGSHDEESSSKPSESLLCSLCFKQKRTISGRREVKDNLESKTKKIKIDPGKKNPPVSTEIL